MSGFGGLTYPPVSVFTSPDDLTTDAADNALIPWIPGRGQAVTTATAQVKTAPTGADILISVKVITRSTGATASTLTSSLTVAASDFTGTVTFAAATIATTQALAVEITQVGSTVAGADLTVEVY